MYDKTGRRDPKTFAKNAKFFFIHADIYRYLIVKFLQKWKYHSFALSHQCMYDISAELKPYNWCVANNITNIVSSTVSYKTGYLGPLWLTWISFNQNMGK